MTKSRSYNFGDLKKRLHESTNEFEPRFGDGVRSQEKTFNREAIRDIEKETKKYDGGISVSKNPNEGKSELAQVNKGMSDIQFDNDPGDKYFANMKAGFEGFTSDLDKKNHGSESLGNATRDDKISKELQKRSKENKDMQDANSEIGITNAQKKKEDTHMHNKVVGESKKTQLLKFKHVQFISESQMLAHIPDEYKNEGKRFYMQDCKGNKYLVEWHDKPEVQKFLNEEQHNAEMDRIKYLFNYNGKPNSTTNAVRMNEDKKIDDMLGRVRELMK